MLPPTTNYSIQVNIAREAIPPTWGKTASGYYETTIPNPTKEIHHSSPVLAQLAVS